MEIQTMVFGPKQYLIVRKHIRTSDIADKEMYASAHQILFPYLGTHNLIPSGPWAVIYFAWDEPKGEAVIGIGVPVDGVSSVESDKLELITVAQTPAALITLHGSYSNLPTVHGALNEYIQSQGLFDPKNLAIEEYVIDPSTETDEEKLVTNVYYLHA